MNESVSNQNQIALITGGSSGIGKAVVKKLLSQNFKVINADITAELSNTDNRYFFKKTDITSGEQVQQLFDFVKNTVGLPSVLICNAGKGIHEKLSDGDPEKWFNVINLNLMGTLRILRSFLPGLQQQMHAHIVIVSSVSSNNPYEYGGIYSATKAALDMIAATLRLELRDKIKVTLISPGIVDTNFFKNFESGKIDTNSIGFAKLNPEDVANAIFYAISSDSNTTINQNILRPNKQTF